MFYNTELEANFPTLQDDIGYEDTVEFLGSTVDAMVRYMESQGLDTADFVAQYTQEMN